MASLQEYVAQQFPNHAITVRTPSSPGELELTDNTVVSHVVGSEAGTRLLNAFRQSAPDATIAALEVRPSEPTVVPTGGEDRDGVVDLPARRVVAFVAIGIIVGGIVGALVALVITDSGVAALFGGLFCAALGAFVGAIVGGGRFAGQRANSQPRAPGETITVVAAFLDDHESATALSTSVGPVADYEVRIVDHVGGWRSPATGSTEQ